jgi:hypothetical protein
MASSISVADKFKIRSLPGNQDPPCICDYETGLPVEYYDPFTVTFELVAVTDSGLATTSDLHGTGLMCLKATDDVNGLMVELVTSPGVLDIVWSFVSALQLLFVYVCYVAGVVG